MDKKWDKMTPDEKIERIEKMVTDTFALVEAREEVPPMSLMLSLFQCQLLLDILKNLESIDARLASIETDIFNDHHNR